MDDNDLLDASINMTNSVSELNGGISHCLFQLAILCTVHCLPVLHNVVVSVKVFFLRDKIKSELVIFKFCIRMYTNGCMLIYVTTTVVSYKPMKYCIKIYMHNEMYFALIISKH